MRLLLQSSDGEIFATNKQTICKCSGTIKTMLADYNLEDEKDNVIPLDNVHSSILRRILRWANYHAYDPVENVDSKIWRSDFFEVDQRTLLNLVVAANYLDAKDVMKGACQKVANMIRGKTPDELRQTFQIPNA